MKLNISISGNKLFFIAPVSLLLLASCSSYQYSGSDRDGVYGDSKRVYSEERQIATQQDKGTYYKNLFAEEASLYNDLLAENAIFTDVESYSSTGEDYEGQQSDYQEGRAPWGQDPDSYSINIINQGFYGGLYNPYWAGMYYPYHPYLGPGYWGSGYYGSSWSIGFGSFYPSYGFGFGFVYPFSYGVAGWHYPYHYRYHRNYYYPQNIAYNPGRRNAVTSFRDGSRSNMRNAVNLDSRRQNSTYSRSIRNLRNSDDQYGLTRRSTGDYNRSRVNDNSRYRSNRQQTTTRSSGRSDTRPATTTRSNTGTVRSSGTTRSSGNQSSSSGRTTTQSRGRGN